MNYTWVSFICKIITISSWLTFVNIANGIDLSKNAKDRPNILIIIADDCTYNDLPLYGGKNAKTPFIDSLAKDGMLFTRAYLAEAMCQPCRSELYTGQYPLRNGCAWNHSSSRQVIKVLLIISEQKVIELAFQERCMLSQKRCTPLKKLKVLI